MSEREQSSSKPPLVSVVVLNYNGMAWLPRCLDSLKQQTICAQTEIILTDNNSADASVKFTREWLAATGIRGTIVQNHANLFYCGANNNGAAVAVGEFLLFLNQDAWLEPDCLEQLYTAVTQAGADSGSPLVMDYDSDRCQGGGGDSGMDFFGIAVEGAVTGQVIPTFNSPGCSLFIRTEMFRLIGGFAADTLGYVDEMDLGWRTWIAGGTVVGVPTARVHHRGAAVVNPKGETQVVEFRTSETKRFLTNRNGMLCLLKNSQHLFLLLFIPHVALLLLEAAVSLVMVRRWSYVRQSYLKAFGDVFRMRGHVLEWRRRIAGYRRRGDFFMLRFLRLKPNRWSEFVRLVRLGSPKVDAR